MADENRAGRILLGVVQPRKKIADMTPEELSEFAAALGDAMAESAKKKGLEPKPQAAPRRPPI